MKYEILQGCSRYIAGIFLYVIHFYGITYHCFIYLKYIPNCKIWDGPKQTYFKHAGWRILGIDVHTSKSCQGWEILTHRNTLQLCKLPGRDTRHTHTHTPQGTAKHLLWISSSILPILYFHAKIWGGGEHMAWNHHKVKLNVLMSFYIFICQML